MEPLLKFSPLLLFALNAVAIWAWWSLRQAVASKRELADETGERRGLDQRVALLEQRMSAFPLDALIALDGDRKAVRAELDALRDGLGRVERSIARIEDYLLKTRP
jgi:hypothetical protein